MPKKKRAAKPARKTSPVAKLPASIQSAMKSTAGWREREILKNAKKIEIKGDNIRVDTGRKTGSPTDVGVFNAKRRQWTN